MNIEEKIRKLFALAKDPGATEAEADTALRMAHKLAVKHSIDIVKLQTGETDEGFVRFQLYNKKILESYLGNINRTIAHLYPAKAYWTEDIVESENIHGTTKSRVHVVMIACPRSFEQAIRNTFDFIAWQIDREYRKALKNDRSLTLPLRRKEFLSGCTRQIEARAERFKLRLMSDDEFAQREAGEKALVIKETFKTIMADCREFLESEGIHLVPVKTRGYSVTSATRAGIKAGNNVRFHQQLGG